MYMYILQLVKSIIAIIINNKSYTLYCILINMTSYQSVKTVECICTSLYDVVVRNERGNSCATMWRRSRILIVLWLYCMKSLLSALTAETFSNIASNISWYRILDYIILHLLFFPRSSVWMSNIISLKLFQYMTFFPLDTTAWQLDFVHCKKAWYSLTQEGETAFHSSLWIDKRTSEVQTRT